MRMSTYNQAHEPSRTTPSHERSPLRMLDVINGLIARCILSLLLHIVAIIVSIFLLLIIVILFDSGYLNFDLLRKY